MLLTRKISVKFESFEADNASDCQSVYSVVSTATANAHSDHHQKHQHQHKKHPVERLIDFLTENLQIIDKDAEKLRDFEQFTAATLVKGRNSDLYRVLSEQGWTGR